MSRQSIIDTASSQNGTVESPPKSNQTKYGQWYGLNGVKWCAIFVSWVYDHAGNPLEKIDAPHGYQSCQSGYMYWKRNNCIVKEPQQGDVVLYDWNGDGICDHTGIFVEWVDANKTTFRAWEGNTELSNDSDGGKVMLRERKKSLVRAFVNPKALNEGTHGPLEETLNVGDSGSDVTMLQKMLFDLGMPVTVDGSFGPGTESAVKAFQKKAFLEVTGIATPEVIGAMQEEVNLPKVPGKKLTTGSYVRKGDSGNAVLLIQQALNLKGANPKVGEDGVYSTSTVNAVKALQQLNKLDSDGIVGPATFHALGIATV